MASLGTIALGTAAFAQDWDHGAPRTIASNGAVVAMPDIDSLSCPEMADVLHHIDLSRYRNAVALSREDPDWQIFDYEDRLTRRHYYGCMIHAHQLADPSDAFSFGFTN